MGEILFDEIHVSVCSSFMILTKIFGEIYSDTLERFEYVLERPKQVMIRCVVCTSTLERSFARYI